MDIQSSKIELIKAILGIENEALINKLRETLLSKNEDFWLELTEAEKEEIDFGIKQIENGQTEDWEDILKRVS